MNQESGIPMRSSGVALAFGCACTLDYITRALESLASLPQSEWVLVFDNESIENNGNDSLFSSVVHAPSDHKNTSDFISELNTRFHEIDIVVLVVADDAPSSLYLDYAFLCSNLYAETKYVLYKEQQYELGRFINIFCKPSESEWAESDGQSVACTLYGNVGAHSSALHSVYLGKKAYERFIDSYYLDDLLKTKYVGYEPEKFYYILYFAIHYFQKKSAKISFVELGATLWATIDKIDLCNSRVNGISYKPEDIEWVSIELSDYLRQLSHLIHPEHRMTFFDHWKNYHRSRCEIGFSHLVSPYAFHDASSVIDWVKGFDFLLWVNDFTLDVTRHLRVNGKSWTLIPLRSTLEKLRKNGMEVYIIDANNLDQEGQIKRTSLLVFNKQCIDFNSYLEIISNSAEKLDLGINDFRLFDFDPAELWESVIQDDAYFDKCAKSFSAGFAGAIAITPTKPYEFKWESQKLRSKLESHFRSLSKSVDIKNSWVDRFKRLLR